LFDQFAIRVTKIYHLEYNFLNTKQLKVNTIISLNKKKMY
jgi:hypothetical protein